MSKAFSFFSILFSAMTVVVAVEVATAAKANAQSSTSATASTTAMTPASVPSMKSLRAQGDLASKDVFLTLTRQYNRTNKLPASIDTNSTSAAITALENNLVDAITSTRGPDPRLPNEQFLNFTPMAYDALVVIVHPKNTVGNLRVTQIRAILKGQIKNWKEVGGADRAIGLVANITPRDGVEYAFRDLLFNNGIQPIAAQRYFLALEPVEQGVSLDVSGIAVTMFSRLSRYVGRLKAVQIEGIAPSASSIADNSYPLVAPLYLVTRASDVRPELFALQSFASDPILIEPLARLNLLPIAKAQVIIGSEAARRKRIADWINPPLANATPVAVQNPIETAKPPSKKTKKKNPTTHD